MEQQTYLLEMRDICKEFPGVKALDNARLLIRPGTVHALVGENGAGKSTLMKCLFGIYAMDSGSILLEGKSINFVNPRHALDNGVSMVHQELDQVPERNIMDNMWLGRYPMRNITVDENRMYVETKKIFDDLNIDLDPRKIVKRLSISQRQMVEIAKAVSYNSKIIVMDEPTSSLTEKEVKHLFNIINRLRDKGCGVIYISHKMEEILAIADDVTVMRDGKWIISESADKLTTDKIINLMVGRDMNQRFPEKNNVPGSVVLTARNITAKYQPSVKEASFELREGEILGVAGLVGSRRTDLVETIFGVRKKESGELNYRGKTIENRNAREAIANGFALLTEERRQTGIFNILSVKLNAIIANIDRYANKWGILNEAAATRDTKWVIDCMNVKTPSQNTKIQNLSGGNQQKVILGRWLLTNPDILLLDEPTKGIDVGAKFEIYQLIIDLAKRGKSIMFVSSEMPELFGVTDRILVMSNGRVAGIVNTKETNQEDILKLASRYL